MATIISHSDWVDIPKSEISETKKTGILDKKILINLEENSTNDDSTCNSNSSSTSNKNSDTLEWLQNAPEIHFETDMGGGIVIKTPSSAEAIAENEEEKRLIDTFSSNGIYSRSFIGSGNRSDVKFSRLTYAGHMNKSTNTRANWNNIFADTSKWLLQKGLEAIDLFTLCDEFQQSSQSTVTVNNKISKLECEDFFANLPGTSIAVAEENISALETSLLHYKINFENVAKNLYGRFAPMDETIYFLEAVVNSLSALMEWNRMWKEVTLAKYSDFRSAFQHCITGLSYSIRSVLEDVYSHSTLVDSERKIFEKNIQIIAPRKERETGRDLRELSTQYLEYLTKMVEYHPPLVPVEILKTSIEMLRPNDSDPFSQQYNHHHLAALLRTVIFDVQEYLDREALDIGPESKSKGEDSGEKNNAVKWKANQKNYEDVITMTHSVRQDRERLISQLKILNKEVLQHWANGGWIDLDSTKIQRNNVNEELKKCDKKLEELGKNANAIIRSLETLAITKRRNDASKFASEHREKFLNALLAATKGSFVSDYAEYLQSEEKLYYRAADLIKVQTSEALCEIKRISVEQIYLSGIHWAEEFSVRCTQIKNNSDYLERYMKEQKIQIDEVHSNYRRRSILNSPATTMELIDVDINRLQSIVAQYVTTTKHLIEAEIMLQDSLTSEKLQTILRKIVSRTH